MECAPRCSSSSWVRTAATCGHVDSGTSGTSSSGAWRLPPTGMSSSRVISRDPSTSEAAHSEAQVAATISASMYAWRDSTRTGTTSGVSVLETPQHKLYPALHATAEDTGLPSERSEVTSISVVGY